MMDARTWNGRRYAVAVLAAVLASLLGAAFAAPAALADDEDGGHSHDDDEDGHSHDDEDGGHSHADAVLWDGVGAGAEDCDTLEPGRMRWEFDPGTEHDVVSAELHIDEPEANVWETDGPPFAWETPFYELDLIEADADGFTGTPGDDATLTLVGYCPTGLPVTGVPVLLLGLFGVSALAGGAALARRR